MLSDEREPTNIGNPTELTILQFAEVIQKLVGSHCKLEFKPMPQDDPKQRKPDISKASASSTGSLRRASKTACGRRFRTSKPAGGGVAACPYRENAYRRAFAAISASCASLTPSSVAQAYSRASVVRKNVGSSVLSVIATPALTSRRRGCSS